MSPYCAPLAEIDMMVIFSAISLKNSISLCFGSSPPRTGEGRTLGKCGGSFSELQSLFLPFHLHTFSSENITHYTDIKDSSFNVDPLEISASNGSMIKMHEALFLLVNLCIQLRCAHDNAIFYAKRQISIQILFHIIIHSRAMIAVLG